MAQTTSVADRLPRVALPTPPPTRVRVLLIVLFCAAVPVAFHLVTPVVSQDEAVLLVHAQQIVSGRVPHRDFFSPYGPAATFGVAAAFKLFGSQYLAERALGMLYHLALAAGVQQATRAWGMGSACLAGSLCGLFLLPLQLVAFAWVAGLACLAWGVALMQASSPTRVTAGAAIAAAGSAWRPELLVPAVAIALILTSRRSLIPAGTGITIGTLPLAVHALVAGRRFIDDVLWGRLGINAQHDLLDIPMFVWAGAALVLLETASLTFTAWRSRSRLDVALAALCILILPQTAQRLDMEHLVYTLCIVGPLAVSQQLRDHAMWTTPFPHATRSVRALVAAAVTACVASALHSAYILHQGPQHIVGHGRHAIPVTDANEARSLEDVLARVRLAAGPGAKVFVGTQDMSVPSLPDLRIYHLLPDYVAHGYFLDLPPGVAERRGSGLVNDVQEARVLVLLRTPPRGTPGYVSHVGGGSADANAAADRFCTRFMTQIAEVRRPCRF